MKLILKNNGGYIVMSALVFSAIFALLFSGLTGFVLVQNKVQRAKENSDRSMQIAEAGLDYYKWFLAHFPDDLQDGTGEAGPYEHEYSDPEGGIIGSFSLDISGSTQCGDVTSVDIESTGWTEEDPTRTRKVYGKYARPSVAEYSYILNSNVWAGSSREIKGVYHSNGGIRMDGENQSLVRSAVADWFCTSSFGCSPNQTVDGVFGDGDGSDLWNFPVVPIDFTGITLNLASMKSLAQSNGSYFGDSGDYGYHLVFKNDRSVDIFTVTNLRGVWGYSSENGWQVEYNIITGESFLQNYELLSDCGLVFLEDKVWVEGEVSGKVTMASANLISPTIDTDVIISGNINYTSTEGIDGLTVIAENSVLIPLNSPDNMEMRGIFIAQNGHFGRNHYYDNYLPSQYRDYVRRNSLEINGTIVSNGRVGTSWGCGYCIDGYTGYASRENSYDRNLMTDPPPFTPFVSDEFKFVEWRDEGSY
ncbi:hypothetical protein ACFLY7_00665 [Patescibacteria group bacterium]